MLRAGAGARPGRRWSCAGWRRCRADRLRACCAWPTRIARARAAAGGATAWTCACAEPGADIPGSYWGESEAGLQGSTLYARPDTPVHSVLHEAAHYICMSPERRVGPRPRRRRRRRRGDAVCYLQVLLADAAAAAAAATRAVARHGRVGLQLPARRRARLVRAGRRRRARLAAARTASSTPPVRLPGGCAPPRADGPWPARAGVAVGRGDQLARDAGLEGGVAGVRRRSRSSRFRPGAMQVPGAAHRADHVVAALHDDGGDVADLRARRAAAGPRASRKPRFTK